MPAPKSSPSRSSSSAGAAKRPASRSKATTAATRSGAKATASSAGKAANRTATQAKAGATRTRKTAAAGAKRTATTAKAGATKTRRASGAPDSLAAIAEQLVNRVLKPHDLVMLTRDRIQDTLDEAAERGRVTRKDANELVAELVRRGRHQTDDLMGEIEQLVDRGREQLGSATKRARRTDQVDRLVRGADRARRTVGVGPSFPILGYDELNATQVLSRLKDLRRADLRKVRTYEIKHANRKSVLAAIDKSLGS